MTRLRLFSSDAPVAERRKSLAQRGSAGTGAARFSSASGAAQLLFAVTIAIAFVFAFATPARAADTEMPEVRLSADNTTGRAVEELTKKAVTRDYASAWRTLTQALNNNDSGILENDFVGIAQEKLQRLVADQLKAGLHTRYVDHGHNLDVLFYSPEGSSIQVRDTAHLEIQMLDGGKLVHSEQVTLHYISLLTPTEVRWKVRLLQAAPEQSSK